MNKLMPFSRTDRTSQFNVEADVFYESMDSLLIEYRLQGPLSAIAFPSSEDLPQRKEGLWKHTCLEAFLGRDREANSPYIEINCSPFGDWNAYAFSSYRQGMAPLNQCQVTMLHREASTAEALFRIRVQLPPETAPFKWASLTFVSEWTDGTHSYWALQHPLQQADFHDKAAFLIPL